VVVAQKQIVGRSAGSKCVQTALRKYSESPLSRLLFVISSTAASRTLRNSHIPEHFTWGVFVTSRLPNGNCASQIPLVTNTPQVKHHRIIVKRICHFVSQMILYLGPLLQCIIGTLYQCKTVPIFTQYSICYSIIKIIAKKRDKFKFCSAPKLICIIL
jgi:hypothetical protein